MRSALVLAAVIALAAGTWSIGAEEPFKTMLEDDLEFTGTETLQSDASESHEIVIGLFAPDGDDHRVGRAITRGAAMAVDRANAAGGADGRRFRLVRRWADDPWGAGSKEVVELVFTDRAWAVIGGPDGATTHVVQQIATKAHVPLIAPVSSDPSLTHTRVPWIFRLPPDDEVQAELLVAEATAAMRLGRIGLITTTDHDSRRFAAEAAAVLEEAGSSPLFHLEAPPGPADRADLIARATAFDPDGLVIRTTRTEIRGVVEALAGAELEIPVFLPWIPGFDPARFPLAYPGPVISVMPFDEVRVCGPRLKFVRAHISRHGDRPSPAAIYGYDAANLVIDAIRSGASGRSELRRYLADSGTGNAASGPISWDTGGGNRTHPVLLRVGVQPQPSQ